jgi:cytidine deaminase
MTDADLLMRAREARKNAYAPYSDFAVGAALLCKNGKVFLGCNVENHSYPAGCCAERTALYNAVSAGERDFEAMAVTGWQRDTDPKVCMPCGICRQALSEFSVNLKIITGVPGEINTFSLGDLLPNSFMMGL